MIRFWAATLALIWPMQAAALSCVAPTVTGSYHQAAASEEVYIIVKGKLAFDAAALPKTRTRGINPPEMTRIPAWMVGTSLSKNGFERPFIRKVTLEVSCLGPWCGSVSAGSDVLAFLRKVDGAYHVDVSPCGGFVFSAPTSEMLSQVTQCMADGPCSQN